MKMAFSLRCTEGPEPGCFKPAKRSAGGRAGGYLVKMILSKTVDGQCKSMLWTRNKLP